MLGLTFDNIIKYSILFYILLLFIIFLIKPRFIFNKDGDVKSFGTDYNDNTTILPLWLVCILLAIISYYIILFLVMIKNN